MVTQDIRKLLSEHLIDLNKITHYKNEGDYWHFFNNESLTGYELYMKGQSVYTLEIWSTKPFYATLALKDAKPFH